MLSNFQISCIIFHPILITIALLIIFGPQNLISQSNFDLSGMNSQALDLVSKQKTTQLLKLLEHHKIDYLNHEHSNPKEVILALHLHTFALSESQKFDETILIASKGIDLVEQNQLEIQCANNYSGMLEILSRVHLQLHNYNQALRCAQRGLDHADKTDIHAKISFGEKIALGWSKLHHSEKALKQFHSTLKYTDALTDEYDFYSPYLHQNISHLHYSLNAQDSAEYYLNLVINFYEGKESPSKSDLFNLYSVAGNRQLTAGNISEARNYIEKASNNRSADSRIDERSFHLLAKAKLLAYDQKQKAALDSVALCKSMLNATSSDTNIITSYPLEYFSILTTELDILEDQYELQPSENNLNAYKKQAIKNVAITNGIVSSLGSDMVKKAVAKKSKPIYRHGLNAYALKDENHLTKQEHRTILRIMESYRAILVNQDMNIKHWMESRDFEAAKRYKNAQHRIDSLLSLASRIPFSEESESPYQVNARLLFEQEMALNELKASMRKMHPEFDRLTSHLDELSSSNIASVQKRNGAILSYFRHESELFIHLLLKKGSQFLKVAQADSIEQISTSWVTELTNYNSPSSIVSLDGTQAFHKAGNLLYTYLLKPIEDKLPRTILLIPDDFIASIPFSALNRAIPNAPFNFRSADYVVNDHEFSTHFSIKLAAYMIEQASQQRLTFTSFTPNLSEINIVDELDGDTMKLPPLFFSAREGQYFSKVFGGQQNNRLHNSDSIVSKFLNNRVVHVGSHVVLNNDFPDQSYLPIFDGDSNIVKLNSSHLYQKPLNVDLIIFNSCFANSGTIAAGQGYLSFASGLARSNVKCILSPGWRVQDKLGFDFFKNCVDELKSGYTIGKALQRTQLYLINRNDIHTSHPRNWANFGLTGDVGVRVSKSWNWVLCLALGLTVGLVLLFARRLLSRTAH